MHADPNIPSDAFHEYAQSAHWIASHLMQFFGFVFITATMALLYLRLRDGAGRNWATLGLAGAIASLSAASMLQAVDGIALKAMIDHWFAAAAPEKAALFAAALAVRQIEIGLASISSILSGLTFIAYGLAFLRNSAATTWLAYLAILGGGLSFLGGLAIAFTGFSELSMNLNMPAIVILLIWLSAISIKAWNERLFAGCENSL